MYFSNFPKINYDFTVHTDATPLVEFGLVDISSRISMAISDSDFQNICQRYTINSGELPEHISFKFYDTTDLAWAILYINNISDIDAEWPLTDYALNKFVATKYGEANINNIHHYEKLPENIPMDHQFIIDMYGADAVNAVTNTDHESIENNYKRLIYVIKPAYIGSFVKTYTTLLS